MSYDDLCESGPSFQDCDTLEPSTTQVGLHIP